MAKLPEGRKPLTPKDMSSLDIIQNDIYGTADTIKQDTLMLSWLRNRAADEDNIFITRIANRFASLTATAQNRKHWTGHE